MHLLRASCVIALSATAASAKARTPSDRDKLQAACYGDVQRLCADAIPDEGRVTACMKSQVSSVSPGCIAAYKAYQAD